MNKYTELKFRGVRHKSLEGNHSAWIKKRSLIGHILCPEETTKKTLESDILTELGALYKVSPSKFALVFGSKTPKEELAGTEIQYSFSDSKVCLNFRKRVGSFRNGKEPILVTIFLPELISDQAVRLPFSNFREVVCAFGLVFKGRHGFNRKIRNGKRHIKIFLAGGDPMIPPRKISFHGSIQEEKGVPCQVGIVLRLHPPQMILACHSLNRVVLHGRI